MTRKKRKVFYSSRHDAVSPGRVGTFGNTRIMLMNPDSLQHLPSGFVLVVVPRASGSVWGGIDFPSYSPSSSFPVLSELVIRNSIIKICTLKYVQVEFSHSHPLLVALPTLCSPSVCFNGLPREPSRFLLLHPIRIQGEMMKHSSGGGGGGDVAAAHSVLGILITPASTRKWRHCYRDSSGDRNKYTEDDEEHGQKTFFIKFSYAPSLRSPTALELRHLITDSISRYLCIQMQSQMISIVCEECRTKDNPITRRMHCVFQLRSPARQISKVKTFI